MRSSSPCSTPPVPNRTGPMPSTRTPGRSPTSGITGHQAGNCTIPRRREISCSGEYSGEPMTDGTAVSGSRRSSCSTGPGQDAMSGSAGFSRRVRTGSAARKTWLPSGGRREGTGSRITVRSSRSWAPPPVAGSCPLLRRRAAPAGQGHPADRRAAPGPRGFPVPQPACRARGALAPGGDRLGTEPAAARAGRDLRAGRRAAGGRGRQGTPLGDHRFPAGAQRLPEGPLLLLPPRHRSRPR